MPRRPIVVAYRDIGPLNERRVSFILVELERSRIGDVFRVMPVAYPAIEGVANLFLANDQRSAEMLIRLEMTHKPRQYL